jgi:hypothetical protein
MPMVKIDDGDVQEVKEKKMKMSYGGEKMKMSFDGEGMKMKMSFGAEVMKMKTCWRVRGVEYG